MEHLSNWTDPLTAFAERGSNLNDSGYRYIEDSSYAVVRKMQTVFVPLIFIFGFLGNLLALGCFLSQSLRATSCCLYMAAKCSSDTAFLAALFVMWLNRVYVNAVNVQGVCQVTVYLSYVSGFTSVWLVLAITFENYIRICRPHLSKTRCTRRVALAAIASIVLFAVFFYSFALWTNTVLGDGEAEVPLCMAMSKFKDVLMVMTFVDTLTTLVLPTLIIVPLVLATLVAIAQSFDRKSRLQDSLINKSARSFKNSLEAMVARFLLAVSLTFVLLHTPGHLIRLKLLVDQYILHKGGYVDQYILHKGGYVDQYILHKGGNVDQYILHEGGYVDQYTLHKGGYVDQYILHKGGYVDQYILHKGGYADQYILHKGGYVDQYTLHQGGCVDRYILRKSGYVNVHILHQGGYVDQYILLKCG